MAALACGVDHPAIAADDVLKLADWYVKVMGLTIKAKTETNTHLLEGADGVFLELMQNDGTARPQRTTFAPGLSHLAFRVKDYAAAEQALTAAGVKWAGDEGKAVGGGRLRSFLDCEGNLLQIVQRG